MGLLPHYVLRHVYTRGRNSAHKTRLLTAIAFNLKKRLKHRPQQQASLAKALPKPPVEPRILLFWRKRRRR